MCRFIGQVETPFIKLAYMPNFTDSTEIAYGGEVCIEQSLADVSLLFLDFFGLFDRFGLVAEQLIGFVLRLLCVQGQAL